MKIKMNKTKGIIAFIISLAVLAFAGYVIMFGIWDRGKAKYITQGLDLKGGVSITYQVAESDKSNLTADTLEKQEQNLKRELLHLVQKQQHIRLVKTELLLKFQVHTMLMKY